MARQNKQAEEEHQKLEAKDIEVHDPGDYVQRGWFYYSQGDSSHAILDFREAAAGMPDDAEALYALGMALKAAGQNEEASAQFQRAIDLAPQLSDLAKGQIVGHLARMQLNFLTHGAETPAKEGNA
jgi:Flp pilus assembly protein TadD